MADAPYPTDGHIPAKLRPGCEAYTLRLAREKAAADAIAAAAPKPPAPPVVPVAVTLAWGEKYVPFASRWATSCQAAGFEPVATVLEGEAPSPCEAWKRKPGIMLEAYDRLGRPVLWTDVDALFRRPPQLGELAQGYDLAAYCSRPGVFEDGVLYVNVTTKAREVLARWADLCVSETAEKYSNKLLSRAITETKPKVLLLEPAYHWCEAWYMADRFGNHSPVIEVNAK